MLRALGRNLLLLALILAGSVALYLHHRRTSTEFQIEQLQQEKQQLAQIVQRLQTERRVARILVTDQKTVGGQLQTTLLFVEYRRDGSALPPRQFTIAGNEAHFDAQVIKFKDQYVQAGDPLRGQSIMLFLRVYGADQSPSQGALIDVPGTIPDIYRGTDPRVAQFEQDLWNRFWTLYNDKDARDAIGIRAMQGEGLYGPFDRDHVYTITVRPDGATMNVDPIDPIYREAMKH